MISPDKDRVIEHLLDYIDKLKMEIAELRYKVELKPVEPVEVIQQ